MTKSLRETVTELEQLVISIQAFNDAFLRITQIIPDITESVDALEKSLEDFLSVKEFKPRNWSEKILYVLKTEGSMTSDRIFETLIRRSWINLEKQIQERRSVRNALVWLMQKRRITKQHPSRSKFSKFTIVPQS